jgi:hypothetical protein
MGNFNFLLTIDLAFLIDAIHFNPSANLRKILEKSPKKQIFTNKGVHLAIAKYIHVKHKHGSFKNLPYFCIK